MRVADELRGISASLRVAAKRSSIGAFLSEAAFLRSARRSAYCFVSLRRRLFFSIELFFAIKISWISASEGCPSLPEREVECSQQRARFVVGLRAGADRDIHAPNIGRLVVVDFGEHHVFLDSERVITATVETLWRQTAEIPHPRQRDIDQPVDEFIHAGLAQRHLAADGLAIAQLVGRDRLARLGDHDLLPGNQREIGRRIVDLLAVVYAFADAHVDDDLLDERHLHWVLVAELIGEFLANHLVELSSQAWRHLFFRLGGLGFAGGLLLAARGLRALWRLLGLFGLLTLRTLVALRGLVALRAFFGLRPLFFFFNHRSDLPIAWRFSPFARSHL